MKSILVIVLFALNMSIVTGQETDYGQRYIEDWKQFYPSKALSRGIHNSIYQYEDRSVKNISAWLLLNKQLLVITSDQSHPFTVKNKIDARLLKIQALKEIDTWEQEKPHQNSLALYTSLINRAVSPVSQANYLNADEKVNINCERLSAIQALAASAIESLSSSSADEINSSLARLKRSENYFRTIGNVSNGFNLDGSCENMANKGEATANSIAQLIKFAQEQLLPKAISSSPILGKTGYSRALSLYTDTDLTPSALSEMALSEINLVRGLMLDVSKNYFQEQSPNLPLPKDEKELIDFALRAMEKDAPTSSADYLEFWTELNAKAIKFIEEKEIATLPEFQTLRIMTAPESAGASARIGWVASAPPFDPNPVTTLYLPSIPETLPEQERIDFWASFNKPFNRIIVIHELFPGHYMQIKISRESPHPVRLLFPYSLYIEGWATFTEKVALDAGWEAGNSLTMLAHLRKRMENANRAYQSVQVHYNGWDKAQVMKFSTESALLAPQFASSLWGRLIRSPMQMTSYFLGGSEFRTLYFSEKDRLGDDFVLKNFMDLILKSGPIPIDEFSPILSQNFQKD
jgi:hypothetical protein